MNFEDSASGYITNETIYGTHEDSHAVMSEKVQTLAGSIYKEFERMIARYDEDVVKTLMPLVINVLECLDSAYQTNQEHEVELELLKEDNEQLITQYDREKSARKHAEQKHLEAEDHYEGEKKELTGRQESLESIVRMLELKHKNSVDHANRLEERENELKKEYTKLHERYTELFKTHMDYMERTKLLISSDRSEVCGRLGINPLPRSSGHISIGFASLEGSVHVVDQSESMPGSPVSLSESPPSPTIGSELAAVQTVERAHQTDPVRQATQATSPVTPTTASRSHTKNEKRSGNTLYQEFAFNDMETSIVEGEEASDITGSMVHPAEYASSVNDNYFGMGKEVENLIKENNELLVTKNALNVVKDDLIDKVDELTGQQEILREEVGNLKAARAKLQERVTQLEDQLRQLKDVVSNNAGGENEDEADVPMAQRKRFTRVEMARVLMERNQYKERFMELQDAVRITEMMRATRVDSTIDKNKQSIWKLFSNLFSSSERSPRPLSTPHLGAVAVPQPAMRHSRTQADFLETQLSDHHHLRRHERTEQFRQVRAHVRKEDGRTQAYGWSLPGKGGQKETAAAASLSSGGVPVPVPVFCRPLVEAEPRMSLQCAAAANTRGGRAADGSCVVGESVFYYGPDDEPLPNTLSLAEEMTSARHCSPGLEDLNRHLESTRRAEHMQRKLSSLVWVCSSTQTKGVVMVIDANNPAEVLSAFPVADKLILCVASVPGATASDYRDVGRNVPNLSLSCVDSPDTGEKSDTSPIGSVKLVQSSMPTPPTSPLKQTDSKNVEDASIGSPPLSSTPKHSEPMASPEPGVDAFAEEQGDGGVTNNLTSVQATMWLGTKSGNLYVHSAIASYGRCLDSVKLNQAILSIVWCAGRVVVALADGTVAIFARLADGKWNLRQYWLLTLGDPKCSVRCLSAVGCTVWCGYRNKVHVVDPVSLELLHTLEAHPRHESQVRQMVCDGDGVWVTIKMDSTLRLYHAHTYKHLGDVDIEPYVSKMLGTGKLGFSLVRITALLISSGRLWIGTSNGVVISVPLSDGCSKDQLSGKNTQGVASLAGHESVSESSIPWCSMAQAQLSFHGHRDAVKFFVAVPGHSSPAGSPGSPPTSPHLAPAPAMPPMLVMSGGEGYIDFRIADSEMEDSVIVAEDGSSGPSSLAERVSKSHLIVWQVARA